MINQIVLASTNQGKIAEFKHIFANFNIEVIPQSKLNIPDIDEPYSTFIENALHKARHCAKFAKLPCLADDSGLCVPSLNGAPGIYSARYAGNPKNVEANINKLLTKLQGQQDRNAYYYCVLVLLRHESDPQPLIADGTLNGVIIDTACGKNGFGYDPHLYLPELSKTAAELETVQKNQISHRAQAIKTLIDKLKGHISQC